MTEVSTSTENRDLLAIQSVRELADSGPIADLSDYLGDGFTVLSDKNALVGVPFAILEMNQHESDKGNGGYFWSLHVITANDERYVINDGGAGIARQCDTIMEMGVPMPAKVKGGLRRSDYVNQHGASTTFYLAI